MLDVLHLSYSTALLNSELRFLRTLFYNDRTRQLIKCQTNTSGEFLANVTSCAVVSAQGNVYVKA